MAIPRSQAPGSVVLEADDFQQLIDVLKAQGYRVAGPAVRDGAIVFDEVNAVTDLPVGWYDEQKPGAYRLRKRRDKSYFAYVVGQHSLKEYLHPPVVTLYTAQRNGSSFKAPIPAREAPKTAFLGVRPCDVASVAVLDRVFRDSAYPNPVYCARREALFIVAVNCIHPSGSCFCASMGTGPKAAGGFDIALTEVVESRHHYFLVDAGSKAGEKVLASLPTTPATDDELLAAEKALAKAAQQMGKTLQTAGLRDALYRNVENPRWEDAAERCLACGNCTLVCPTCFCTTVEDTTNLSGSEAERRQRWDSCFTLEHSYVHGGSVRTSGMSRYRQWLMHKLAYWWDQFGTSGCVGCGRCITWCPAGIDITQEAGAVRSSEQGVKEEGDGNVQVHSRASSVLQGL
jgi:Fe-S-cluster-containing hydrogenase component 2